MIDISRVLVVLVVFFIAWYLCADYLYYSNQREQIFVKESMERMIPTPKIMTRACDYLNIPYKVESRFEIDIDNGKLKFNKAITNLNPVKSRLLTMNKRKCSTALDRANIAVPKFQAFPGIKSEQDIDRILQELEIEYPLVVKPACGSSGVFVRIGVESDEELRDILNSYINLNHRKIKCSEIMIEELVQGENYRILCLGDKILDIIKREIPYVIGDGKTNLAKLVEKWDAFRKEFDLYPMQVDWESLEKDGILGSTIVPNGQKFTVTQICGCCVCNYIKLDLNSIHKSYVDEFRRVNGVLGLGFSGIDVMATDLTRPGNAKINEVNSAPSLRPHYYRDTGYMSRERDLQVPVDILKMVVETETT